MTSRQCTKEGRCWEGFPERCDHWEFQGKVEVAFSVGDLSERLSGRKALFIPASTTFDAAKSIPLASERDTPSHSQVMLVHLSSFLNLPLGVCEVSLAYSHQMAPALSGEGSSVTCWMVLALNIIAVIFPTCHISGLCRDGRQSLAAQGMEFRDRVTICLMSQQGLCLCGEWDLLVTCAVL